MKWLLLAFAVWALLAWYANRSVFLPMPYPAGDWSAQSRLHAQDVGMTTPDRVHLHAWWVQPAKPDFVTLYLHGNAGNVTHREAAMRTLLAVNSAVLLLDYRGYGKSSGSPTERGVYVDAETAYVTLRNQHWQPGNIVLFGESLGTAVAVELASRLPCAGLVLEAPFPSARAVAQTVIPILGPLCVWGFDTRSRLAAVHAPILVVHGRNDEVIPFRLGQAVFAAAREPKRFYEIPSAGHNDIPESGGPDYVQVLREFYSTLNSGR